MLHFAKVQLRHVTGWSVSVSLNEMLRHILATLLFLPITLLAQRIEAGFIATGFLNGGEPYIETYVGTESNTLTWDEDNSLWTAGCEVTILLKQAGRIVNFDKFDLVTRPMENQIGDSSFTLSCLRRIAIEPGDYSVEVELRDLHDISRARALPAQSVKALSMEGVVVSDIYLLDDLKPALDSENELVKNGLAITPNPHAFFVTDHKSLSFYAEVYGLEQDYRDDDLMLMYQIRKPGFTEPVEGFVSFSKQKGSDVNFATGMFPLKELPSGNYELVVEARSKSNELIALNSVAFQRSNKLSVSELANLRYLDVTSTFVNDISHEELPYYLRSLKPQATTIEQRAIDDLIATNDLVLMQKFFYNFWLARDPVQPGKIWNNYLRLVQHVNREYVTINREGFETDRGRVYLQYGPPSDIHESRFEAGSKPYEIWQYDIIRNNETNVSFVFYNDDLVSNEYRLLHSTATGEIRNEHWKLVINENFNFEDSKDFDNTNARDRFGTHPYELIPD